MSEQQELIRARHIIEKAERDGSNVVDTLKSHMVSNTLIEELTGEAVVLARREQKRDMDKELQDWCRINASLELTTAEIQSMLKVTDSLALKLVKNTDYFVKVKRGLYMVRDGLAEREAVKTGKILD